MINSEDFFNSLTEQLEEGRPFAAYRKAFEKEGETKAILQENKEIYTVEDFTESGFIFSGFETSLASFLIPQQSSKEIITNYPADEVSKKIESTQEFPPEQTNVKAKIAHEKLVQKGIEEIQNKGLEKVVLSRQEEVSTQLSPIEIFKKLLKKYSDAFVYLWFHPNTGYWLGATPETLLKTKRNKFKTMALAGTQAFKGSTEVTWGDKEKEEQQLVTNYILETINSMSDKVKNVEYSKTYTSRAGNLLHLRSDIVGELEHPEDLKNLIKSLHPTPAVCGLPKEKSRQFILKNENYDRMYYSGVLGELNFKSKITRNKNRSNQENQQFSAITSNSDLYVNLRCMQLEAGKAKIFVGGGITAHSNPASEWEETQDKAQTIKSVLVK